MKRRILLAALVLTVLAGVKAQAQAENETAGLKSVSEATMVDGHPVLRLLTSKGATSPIMLDKRDGEEALIFRVKKNSFQMPSGALFVTKTRIVFDPYEKKSKFFTMEKASITKTWREDNPYAIVVIRAGTVSEGLCVDFNMDRVSCNKKFVSPAHDFLMKAVMDFDGAMAEFKLLTASAIPKTEEDEEDTGIAETGSRYDRFRDATTVSTSRMLVRDAKRSIRVSAEYEFSGRTRKPPATITLYFSASAPRPVFLEDDLKLNFMIDDKRLPIGPMRLKSEEQTNTSVRQTLAVSVPYNTFLQIANAKKAEFQIGDLEYKFGDAHLEAFRGLIAYNLEDQKK